MRHDQIFAQDSYRRVVLVAVWPAGAQEQPAAVPETAGPAAVPFLPTPSSPDIPVAVGRLIVAAYLSLIAALTLVAIAGAYAFYMLAVVLFFVAAFFAVPRIFLGVEPTGRPRPSFDRFLREGVAIPGGRSSGRDALIQMLIVPVSLTLGILSMGLGAAILL